VHWTTRRSIHLYFVLDNIPFLFYSGWMDWNFSIERNRALLLPIIVGLFALIGLVEGAMVERLSRPVYRRALTVLKSAESAVRRLIIVMARNIKVEPRPKRPMPKGLTRSRKGTFQSNGNGQGNGQGRKPSKPCFNLFDPERRADFGQVRRRRRKGRQVEPRIHTLDYDPRIPEPLRSIFSTSAFAPPPPPHAPQPVEIVKDYTVSAKRLCRRLFAIMYALTHMEREVERYALWLAKPKEERRPKRERALRFGWPPGWRIKSTHEVDDILKECHWLVRSLPEPDTS
jgi:hypothetical protein